MRLLDLTEFIVDCPHSTAADEGEGIALIRTPNIGAGFFILDNVHRVSESVYEERIKRGKPQRDDLIYAREAPAGNVAIVKDEKVCLGQRTVLIRSDAKKVNPYYLMYYLLSDSKKNQLLSKAHGSTVSHVNMKEIRELNVDDILPLDVQHKIASILSAYDSQIENNQKRIKLLEQMAENLYKEWFVRFRFPGYETAEFEGGVPKGWKIGKLKDISQESGKAEKKENRYDYQHYIPIDCIGSKSMVLGNVDSIENAESSLVSFKKTDILFGAMRPYFHKVIMAPFSGLTRSTCFVISPNDENYRYFLYLLLFQKASIDYATTVCVGSTMPYANWKDFSRMPVVIPSEEVVSAFSEIIKPIIETIERIYFSNDFLIKQRDLLLPRLMSGKLSI